MEYFDPESQNLMRENLKVAKENNELLHKIWRDVKYRRTFKAIYWLIIIAIALGAYYYIQPIIDAIDFGGAKNAFSSFIENINMFNRNIPSI